MGKIIGPVLAGVFFLVLGLICFRIAAKKTSSADKIDFGTVGIVLVVVSVLFPVLVICLDKT